MEFPAPALLEVSVLLRLFVWPCFLPLCRSPLLTGRSKHHIALRRRRDGQSVLAIISPWFLVGRAGRGWLKTNSRVPPSTFNDDTKSEFLWSLRLLSSFQQPV